MIRSARTLYCMICMSYFFMGLAFTQNEKAFLHTPEVIAHPESSPQHAVKSRKFTGIPSMAISKGGRFWSTWYTGTSPGEDANNYVVVSSSIDHGNTWHEQLVIDPDGEGPVRAFDPEMWVDPDGKLWVFWAQAVGHDATIGGVWAMTTMNPEAERPDWSTPRRLTDGVMMCKPTVLSNGDWVLPASTWRLTDYSARVIVSKDKGRSWDIRGAVDVPVDSRAFDEHMIIERKDETLWMLVRTKYGMGESVSDDMGKTWSDLVPSDIKHPSARFFLRRLQSGNLLLVKHGPINMKIQRSHLMAFISQDDGISWSKGLLLDQRKGVSYPDGQQGEDGVIHIVYDYNRTSDQNVFITSFTESDVLADDYDERILSVYDHRKVISTGGVDP